LVCITPQGNSSRLIDKGFELARSFAPGVAEVHILYVQRGDDVFGPGGTPELLQSLFDYGAERGGVIHAVCGNDAAAEIIAFIRAESITRAVLGEPPKDAAAPDGVIGRIKRKLPWMEIVVLERNVE